LGRLHSEISKKSVRVFLLNSAYIFYGSFKSYGFYWGYGNTSLIFGLLKFLFGDFIEFTSLTRLVFPINLEGGLFVLFLGNTVAFNFGFYFSILFIELN